MIKVKFLFLCAAVSLFGADFITQREYAKMLYENPRGISCKECHGESGKEQILEYITHKGKKTPFIVPNIQSVSFDEFVRALSQTRKAKSIMPTYSLTKEEIKALYAYIQNLSKEKR